MKGRATGVIERLGGFIEQQHIAVFAQRQRKQQSLSLTAAEPIDPQPAPGWNPWIRVGWRSGQGDQIGHAEGTLGQHGTVLREMSNPQAGGPTHVAGEGLLLARQRTQQAAFPGTVLATNQDQATRFDAEIERFEQRAVNTRLQGIRLKQDDGPHGASAVTQCSINAK